MEVIVKTNYNGKEEKEVLENVKSISQLNTDSVTIDFTTKDGHKKLQVIFLDGYTELIIR